MPVTQAELNAAVALFQAGKTSEALSEAQRLARRTPDLVPLLDLQGACLQAQGDPAGALAFFRRSLDAGGDPAIGHYNVGVSLFYLCRYDEASSHLGHAVALAPENVQSVHVLALALNAQGLYHDAAQLLSLYMQNNQLSDGLLNTLGQSLRHLGRLAEAKACHSAVTDTHKAGAEAQYELGIIASAEGEAETAELHFRAALELEPKMTTAHRSLSSILKYQADDPHLAGMERLLKEPGLSVAAEVELRFGLFKAHHDAAQHEAAFGHLTGGNHLKKRMIGYSIHSDEKLFGHLQRIFQHPAPAPGSALPFRPVFIVGLPRSGTTLTERILCGSRGVKGAGELPYATTAMSNLLKDMQAQGQTTFTQVHAHSLREALGPAMHGHVEDGSVVIDKMPLNLRWLGGLLAAFPEARVVYTTRPPRDMFWSLFKVCFQGSGNGFIYDAEDIIRYQVLAHQLMQHWMQLFPGQIHQVRHDRLTQDPEEHIRALVEFCDLEWSPECLHPENRQAAIQTASSQQARKPIYHQATPDWQPYESYLEPAFAQLDQLDL